MSLTYTKVQLRRGTAVQWTEYNSVLDIGEIGFETDTYKFKIGQVNQETGLKTPWNELAYFGDSLKGEIEIDDEVDTTFIGDIIPHEDNTYTLGEAARRWKRGHFSSSIQLGEIQITQGPAGPATGQTNNFLKVNGDDLATRTELEKVTSDNLKLLTPDEGDEVPFYLAALFNVLERELPPTGGVSTQSQFNNWVVQALEHVDEVAHRGGSLDSLGNLLIGGDGIDVILGPPIGSTCQEKFDIYATTTVHCELKATQGVKSITEEPTHFLKANGTISDQIPLVQSNWDSLPRLS